VIVDTTLVWMLDTLLVALYRLLSHGLVRWASPAAPSW